MLELLGVSLIVLAGLMATKAHGQQFPDASSASEQEPWQIVAEMQILHITTTLAKPDETSARPALADDTAGESSGDTQAPFQIAAAQTVQHTRTATAALPSDMTTINVNSAPAIKVPSEVAALPVVPLAAPAPVVRPPVPRGRPVAAPPPPIVNSREDICNTLAASAAKHGLPVAFFGNLIYQESGLKPRVVSHVGARGIAQFMPGTARMVGLKNPFNPREALPASAKFLRSLLHQFGNNYGLAAAAYNAGPGKVSRWLKRRTVLPKETRDYVMTITGQQAEKWRGMRGNRFGHRLTHRMPCNSMPSFARINDPVFLEKDMVRKALLMLPRTSTQAARVIPVSLATSASAAPASSDVTQRQDERLDNVNTPTVMASAVDMPLPRMSSSEQTTGAVTAVVKTEPAPAAARPARAAALTSPAEKHAEKQSGKTDTRKAEAKKAEAKKAEAKQAEKKKAEIKKLAAKKAEAQKVVARKTEIKQVAAAKPATEKDAWTEYYAGSK